MVLTQHNQTTKMNTQTAIVLYKGVFKMNEFRDMDGVVLQLFDTVVIAENCLYVPKLCRGVIVSIEEDVIYINTENSGVISIQDERQVLYLFT